MRVLHLFNEINFSGAEIMYATAASVFQEQGVELLAFSTGKSPGNFTAQFIDADIKIFHWPVPTRLFSKTTFKFYKDFYDFLKTEQVDILHVHRQDLFVFTIISRFARVKTIKTQHNTFRNRWFTLPWGILNRIVSRTMLKITYQTIGESVYLNELNYYKNPSVRINNWFDGTKFYPPKDNLLRLAVRAELSLPRDAFVIVSTGSCSSIKNHSDIIRALALLKGKFECYYLHLGSGSCEHNEIELAKKLGVFDSIRFLGNKVNVRDYLVSADLFVMSSKFEGLSIASIEAMACKLPTVLYNVPGLRDLIKDKEYGFLIESDFDLLAESIELGYRDRLMIKQMAEKAYENVNNEFSMETNAREILKLYRKDNTGHLPMSKR